MNSDIGLEEDPHAAVLITAYKRASKSARKADKESDGWVCRISEIEGLDAEAVSAAHGYAIAANLIEVQVEDATTGLRYRPRRAA